MSDVKTRVIIDANASNAIKEIDKLDETAADADKTIKKLDDQTVDVEVNADGMDRLRQKGEEAIAEVKALSDQKVVIDVDADKLDKLDTTRAKQGLDDVAKSADSSKSVLANMVGNATQDLGALGGIAGSAGVAIGQMGEYMVDAANDGDQLGTVVKNFAAVAGPIAAISAGIFLLTEGVKAYNKPSEDAAKRTKQLGEAMADSGDDAVAFTNVLRKNTDVLNDFIADANDPLGGFGTAVDEAGSHVPILGKFFKEAGVDIFDASKRAGLSVFDLGKQIAGTGKTTKDFEAQLRAAADAGKISGDEMRGVAEAVAEYSDSAAQAAKDQGLFNVNAAEANAIFQSMADPLDKFSTSFNTIKTDLADGAINFESTANTINMLADALGITTEEVIALANEDLKGDLEESGTAASNASDKTKKLADGYRDARDAADDLTYANSLLRGDLDHQEAYLHLQAQFDETKRRGSEAMEAVHKKTDDAASKMRDYELSVIESKTAVMDFNDEWSNVDTDQQITMNTQIDRGQFDDVMWEIGAAVRQPHYIDVRVRTTVDQAWERVMGSRFP